MATTQAEAELAERRVRPLYGEGLGARPQESSVLCARTLATSLPTQLATITVTSTSYIEIKTSCVCLDG